MKDYIYKGIPVVKRLNINGQILESEIVDGNLLIPIPTNFGGFNAVFVKVDKELIMKMVKEVDDLK